MLLPRSNPTISYWQDPPDAEVADYLSGETVPEVADTVIIGSGITGTSIAYGLLNSSSKPAGKVVILEARQACSGATGRNGTSYCLTPSSLRKYANIVQGGHTKAASYRTFPTNEKSHSLSTAVQIARFEYQTIKSIHTFIRSNNIQCDSYSGDTVDIIYDQAQWDQAKVAVKAMQEAMPEDLEGVARYIFWEKEEAREKFKVKGQDFMGAVTYEAGSLSAYKFVIGVLKLCLKEGLGLYTNTPATKVEKGDDGLWSVETNRGVVKAKRVVLATNGYTGYIWKGFQGAIVPLRGQVTAHRPGKNMPKEGLGVTFSFIYAKGYEYMIPRPLGSKFENDIIIGGGLMMADNDGLEEYGTVDDTTINPAISTYLTETTARYFGSNWGDDHPDGRIRKQWTGIMGFSSDGFPFIGEVPGEKDLWVAASFQGHGMVLCWSCAKALVSMINGEEEGLGPWFPDVFKVSKERMETPFTGRVHLKPLKK